MSIFSGGENILLFHILPSIVAALVYFLFAQLFLFVFRVKKPAYRYSVYLIVLYKSVLLLVTGAMFTTNYTTAKPFTFGSSFYDPLDLLPLNLDTARISKAILIDSPWLGAVLTICLIVIVAMLLLRWAATIYYFQSVINEGEKAGQKINNILKELSVKFKLKEPALVLSATEVGPMTIGILKPTIVLPKPLVQSFSSEELEIIVAHELAHVKRKDNFWQWIVLMFKDLLLLSPFSRLVYQLLQAHKEAAADFLLLQKLPDKSHMLSQTIDRVVKADFIPKKKEPEFLVAKSGFINLDLLGKRQKILSKFCEKRFKDNLATKISGFICVFIFFWFKFWILIDLGNKKFLMLLS